MRLRIHRVTAAYGRTTIFRDASLTVDAGEVVGLIAPNGAGKTTLLRVAAGFIRPRTGVVRHEGHVMYFGGEATVPPTCRVSAWSALIGGNTGDRRQFRRLSRGTRQKAGLAAWLSRTDWSIGLLDEPWEGLDPAASIWLTREIRRHANRGAGLIISSHRLHDVVETCATFAFLGDDGIRIITPRVDSTDARIRVEDLIDAFDPGG